MALARSATGPLSPHLPAFITSLMDQRYAVVCVRAKAWRAVAFDAWLVSRRVDLAHVEDAHVDQFIRRAYQPRSDCQAPPRRDEPFAVRQLLDYLRGQGLCMAAPATTVPADATVSAFEQFLLRERGLARPRSATTGRSRTTFSSIASARAESISARCVPRTSLASFSTKPDASTHARSSKW